MPSSDQWLGPLNRLLPYTFLCTIGPAVTASRSLFVVRELVCQYYWWSQGQGLPDDGACNSPRVEALTGSVMAGLAVTDGIVSFLTTSLVQRLADRLGRKPLLVALPLIAIVASASLPIAYTWKNPIATWVLFALNGIFVSASTKSVFVPTLCVADLASDEERTRFYSSLEAVALLGPGSAYLISALVSRYISNVLFVYYIAIGCQVLASVYAATVIPETLQRDESRPSSESGEGLEETLVAPIKPLAVLLPTRDSTGKLSWRLSFLTISVFMTTCGTVFIATASLLYLTDKFQFDPEQNGWVLAYLTFSRFAYLSLIFPFLLRFGRKLFHRFAARRNQDEERRPLNRSESAVARDTSAEANHFDVLLAFLSVTADAVSFILVALSASWQQVIASFSVYALGAGDNPTFKSVFVSAVPEEMASQALTALDMILSMAKLASPLVLGSMYAAFVQVGRPEMLFVAAAGFCAVAVLSIAPLVFAGRR